MAVNSYKIVIDGITYNIDASKVAGAVAEIEAVLGRAIISFSIDGIAYEAPEGMTWGNYLDSCGGEIIHNGMALRQNEYGIANDNWEFIRMSRSDWTSVQVGDLIIAGHDYAVFEVAA